MALPDVVSHEQWLRARIVLLAQEKELTRLRDRVVAERRRLPMVKVDQDYRFTGPDGEITLEQMFEGRAQLIVGHFMFDPDWEDGCSSCTAGADEMSPGHLEHLHARDTTLAYVSRAPYEKLARYQAKRGWTFPWYSSHGSSFNYDFAVTLDASVTPPTYNYKDADELRGWGPSRRASSPAAARSCAPPTESSTPTRCSPAGPRRSAVRTTCSTRPRSGDRRSGRSRRAGSPRRVPRCPISRPERPVVAD